MDGVTSVMTSVERLVNWIIDEANSFPVNSIVSPCFPIFGEKSQIFRTSGIIALAGQGLGPVTSSGIGVLVGIGVGVIIDPQVSGALPPDRSLSGELSGIVKTVNCPCYRQQQMYFQCVRPQN